MNITCVIPGEVVGGKENRNQRVLNIRSPRKKFRNNCNFIINKSRTFFYTHVHFLCLSFFNKYHLRLSMELRVNGSCCKQRIPITLCVLAVVLHGRRHKFHVRLILTIFACFCDCMWCILETIFKMSDQQ